MTHLEPAVSATILKTATRASTLDALMTMLASNLTIAIDAASEIRAAIERRMELGPIALGQGVALPHCRHTAVTDARLIVAVLTEPNLDWQSLDAEPVDIVFFAVFPIERSNSCAGYFERLVRSLRFGLAEKLRSTTSPHELLEAFKSAMNPSAFSS